MTRTWVDAGGVEPGTTEYTVALADNHKTLRQNDLVVTTVTPSCEYMLLRKSDMTLHSRVDERGQYVILEPAVSTPPPPASAPPPPASAPPPPASAPVCESAETGNPCRRSLWIGRSLLGDAIRIYDNSWAYDKRAGATLAVPTAADLRAIADELDRLNGGAA